MMVKNTAALALAILLFTATAISQSANTNPPLPVAEGDAYAVYSVVIPKELTGLALRFDRYVIAQQTVTEGWETAATPMRRSLGVRDCIAIPPGEASEYEAAIANFERRNNSSVPLGARLNLDKPYVLLSDEDVTSFRLKLAATWGFARPDYQPEHRFDGDTTPLISVSRVGFSDAGKVAIVYVEHDCGSTCGGGSVHVLRKQNDSWAEPQQPTCAWNS